jgi:hypothetical protein
MAETGSNPKPNSGASWTFPPMAFLGAPFPDRPHVSEQAARAGLMGLDMIESWLTASRQMIDLWRTTVRELQDGMLATCRQQIVEAYAHDLLEDMEAPKPVPAKRQPLTRTAVAKNNAASVA